jgi:uncharacterized protein YndB with AHSA1/START domain
MSEAPVILTVTRALDAAPERMFDAWLDPAMAGRFLFATPGGEMVKVEIDARVGGGFEIVERRPGGTGGSGDAHHYGRYEVIDRPERLIFLFRADPSGEEEWTRVSIVIAPADGGGCVLTLTHEMDPQWAAYAAQTRKGWTMILGSLATLLENGHG